MTVAEVVCSAFKDLDRVRLNDVAVKYSDVLRFASPQTVRVRSGGPD